MATANAVNVSTSAVANQVLLSNSSSFANWSTATYPATTTINRLLYSSATNVVSDLATANNSVLVTNASGVPSLGTNLANDFTFDSSATSTNRTLLVRNTSNTAAAGASCIVQSGGSTALSPLYRASVSGATDWVWGINNPVTTPHADPFAICQGYVMGTNVCMSIDTSGYVTMPLQPCVVAYPSGNISNVTGDNTDYTIILNSTFVDRASSFNTGTGTFTAPVTGLYRFSLVVAIFGMTSAHTQSKVSIVTTTRNYDGGRCSPYAIRDVSGTCTLYTSGIADMAAGDTAVCKVLVNSGTKVISVTGGTGPIYTHFAISLIC